LEFYIEKLSAVMAGLVPAIHAGIMQRRDVDARHKAGHDNSQLEENPRKLAP